MLDWTTEKVPQLTPQCINEAYEAHEIETYSAHRDIYHEIPKYCYPAIEIYDRMDVTLISGIAEWENLQKVIEPNIFLLDRVKDILKEIVGNKAEYTELLETQGLT